MENNRLENSFRTAKKLCGAPHGNQEMQKRPRKTSWRRAGRSGCSARSNKSTDSLEILLTQVNNVLKV